jgi:hypothetical protein
MIFELQLLRGHRQPSTGRLHGHPFSLLKALSTPNRRRAVAQPLCIVGSGHTTTQKALATPLLLPVASRPSLSLFFFSEVTVPAQLPLSIHLFCWN